MKNIDTYFAPLKLHIIAPSIAVTYAIGYEASQMREHTCDLHTSFEQFDAMAIRHLDVPIMIAYGIFVHGEELICIKSFLAGWRRKYTSIFVLTSLHGTKSVLMLTYLKKWMLQKPRPGVG